MNGECGHGWVVADFEVMWPLSGITVVVCLDCGRRTLWVPKPQFELAHAYLTKGTAQHE